MLLEGVEQDPWIVLMGIKEMLMENCVGKLNWILPVYGCNCGGKE